MADGLEYRILAHGTRGGQRHKPLIAKDLLFFSVTGTTVKVFHIETLEGAAFATAACTESLAGVTSRGKQGHGGWR